MNVPKKMDKVSPTLQYTLFFIFILVYFSAHDITKVNIMRQLQYGAGGFSYKSIRTLQELFLLLNYKEDQDQINGATYISDVVFEKIVVFPIYSTMHSDNKKETVNVLLSPTISHSMN